METNLYAGIFVKITTSAKPSLNTLSIKLQLLQLPLKTQILKFYQSFQRARSENSQLSQILVEAQNTAEGTSTYEKDCFKFKKRTRNFRKLEQTRPVTDELNPKPIHIRIA